MTTHATIAVALAIMEHGDKDRWKLADAILTDAPGTMPGAEVPLVMDELCSEMTLAEITKADGTFYNAGYLKIQRDTSLVWDTSRRCAEASFEAHSEQRANPLGQEVLIALCAVARGVKGVMPPAGVEKLAWEAALAKIATKKMSRYKVQTNAVRIALQRRGKNSPERLESATFAELLHHLMVGVDGLRAFNARVADEEVTPDDARRFIKVLDLMDEQSAITRDAITLAGVTDLSNL